jgi:hypothetical protein
MRGVTWVRDSHGLFDYESRSIAKKSWMTHDQSRIVRHENDIKIIELMQETEEDPPTEMAGGSSSSSAPMQTLL